LGHFSGTGNYPGAGILGDGVVVGEVFYWGVGTSFGNINNYTDVELKELPIPLEASAVGVMYSPATRITPYLGNELQMLQDLLDGRDSPIYPNPLLSYIREYGVRVGANVFIRKGWVTLSEVQARFP
jgi:hypothetical protein